MNQNKTLLSIMPLQSLLSGNTWNFVNESNGPAMSGGINPDYNEIMKIAQKTWAFAGGVSPGQPMEFMNNMTHFTGRITFYWYQIKINASNGLNPTYTSNPSWDLGEGGKTLVLDGITPFIVESPGSEYFPSQSLTFLKISEHLIELKDKHGDTIYLTRPVAEETRN